MPRLRRYLAAWQPALAGLLLLAAGGNAWGQGNPPALPPGLEPAEPAPALPPGLGGVSPGEDTPAIPESSQSGAAGTGDGFSLPLTGFAELRLGPWLQQESGRKRLATGETRLHLRFDGGSPAAQLSLAADLRYDGVARQNGLNALDASSGTGPLEIREATLLLHPADNAVLRIGRQPLSWGTGDMLFVNDLFPKDWNALLLGRDDAYLKAPSDAVRLNLFGDIANLDLAYSPRFNPDRFPDGQQISFFSAEAGRVIDRANPLQTRSPDDDSETGETALRLYRSFGSWEGAVYFYRGFWKSPNGQDAGGGLFTFPPLAVYGASLRGPVAGGLGYAETGRYLSLDDPQGNRLLTGNSEYRLLLGYEHSLGPDTTAGTQYYLERMEDYSAYRASLPPGVTPRDRTRQLATLRLTRLLMNQDLELSLFLFWSPSDADSYLRPRVSYRLNDDWRLQAGGNIFRGARNDTPFGRFSNDDNLYVAVRRLF